MDWSTGYEAVSEYFLARRGKSPCVGVGVKEVWEWAKSIPPGSSVIDLGCGSGFPLTAVLVDAGLEVFGLDGAPSFVAAFQRNFPGIPILCEAVQDSRLFDRSFDAALAWGLIFLLKVDEQHRLIQRFSEMLAPGGRLLFTSPAKAAAWIDGMTDLESVSLGAERYRTLLEVSGLTVLEEFEDEGENHYYSAEKGVRSA
jgi:SAM-dependent methyltransferase